MPERPILFSGAMVRAILDGRKSQTRRVIKLPAGRWHTGSGVFDRNPDGDEQHIIYGNCGINNLYCPYGSPGDVLWVRETWGVSSCYDGMAPRDIHSGAKIAYFASGGTSGVKARPSIFMPRWASRISLRITRVEVQRVQVISTHDALAEGMVASDRESPTDAFHNLWDTINAKRGFPWESNPWVWALTFERVE